MGKATGHAYPPSSQIDDTPKFTQGVVQCDDDGVERLYIQNKDSAAWVAGDPIMQNAGDLTQGKKALSTDDGEPEGLLGFAMAAVGSDKYGWIGRRGKLTCAIASGASIESNTPLTLRGQAAGNIGLSSVPNAATSAPAQRPIAYAQASIASNATTAAVVVQLP